MVLEKLADIEPSAAARKRWSVVKSKASNVCSDKVRPRKHIVVVVDGDDHVATLLVRVENAHIASLDATPRQMRVKLGVLHMRQKGHKAGPNKRAPWTCKPSDPQRP
jgi:hypothetical protein